MLNQWNIGTDKRHVDSSLVSNVLLLLLQLGELGKGAGKGGGGGGSVREAGGAFGKREAAQEEQYFRQVLQIQVQGVTI